MTSAELKAIHDQGIALDCVGSVAHVLSTMRGHPVVVTLENNRVYEVNMTREQYDAVLKARRAGLKLNTKESIEAFLAGGCRVPCNTAHAPINIEVNSAEIARLATRSLHVPQRTARSLMRDAVLLDKPESIVPLSQLANIATQCAGCKASVTLSAGDECPHCGVIKLASTQVLEVAHA